MRSITRRQLLAAFLGSPSLSVVGCAKPTPPLPPGRLVGASVDLGHRVRDMPYVDIPEARWKQHQVVIVGAGVAGLSAARRLLRGGIKDFVIIELERQPGGTSRSGQSQLVGYPWGAHYLPAPQHNFQALIDLLDELDVFEGRDERGDPIVAEQYRCRYPQERIFYKGSWYPGLYLRAGATVEDLSQLSRFEQLIAKWVGWRDAKGRRAFAVPMAHGTDDTEIQSLDRLSMSQWMDQQGFTSPRLRWLVDYACRDDYGAHADIVSAWAGLYYFAARVPRPGAASRPFITWPEGNGRLIHHMYRHVRRQTELGWTVTSVQPIAGSESPWAEVRAINAEGRPCGYRARQVILAVPQFQAPYLMKPYRRDPPPHIASFQYGAWAVANLTLDALPREIGFPIAWDNVLYESPSLGYVATTYQRGLDHGPAVLTYYYALCDKDPSTARARLLLADRDDWAEIALSDLQRAHPRIRHQTRRIDVMRWGHAMIRPDVGFVWSGARQTASRPTGGIRFAHSDLSGLPLFEEAFYRGTLAAEGALRDIGMRVTSVL